MYAFLFLLTFGFLYSRRGNKGYKFLVLVPCTGFCMQYIIGLECNADSLFTLFNILFTCLNIILIHLPWAKVSFTTINVNTKYLLFLNRYLRPLLYFNLFLSAILGITIALLLPSIVDFKQDGLKELYGTIPYFANAFRYAYTSQYFGYIGIPICLYYLSVREKKQSLKWMIASFSSLVAGIAFYSRANIICYAIEFLVFYLFFQRCLHNDLKRKINILFQRVFCIVAIVFITMSYSRFSKMEYLSDRIPKESLVQDLTSYYLLYYASQGFPYGIESLEKYKPEVCMEGSRSFYNIKQILGFFIGIEFDAESAMEKVENTLGSDLYDKFLGYTSYSVYDIGYCGTLIVSVWFYLFVSQLFRKRENIKLYSLLTSSLLLQVTINSLFYGCFGAILIPYLFIVGLNFVFKLNILK